jgi:hypothetical protein
MRVADMVGDSETSTPQSLPQMQSP